MPLLTSKNIWCPCLPHRLICNTFCCCFHLTSIARVNNNLHFLYFYFRLILFCFFCLFFCFVVVVLAIYLVFGLISVARRGQQWNNKYEVGMLRTIWSAVALFWSPPPLPPPPFFLLLLLLLGLDLVVVIPWRLLRSPVYPIGKKKKKYRKKKKQNTKSICTLKRALH